LLASVPSAWLLCSVWLVWVIFNIYKLMPTPTRAKKHNEKNTHRCKPEFVQTVATCCHRLCSPKVLAPEVLQSKRPEVTNPRMENLLCEQLDHPCQEHSIRRYVRILAV
jgi:hypothetical protein